MRYARCYIASDDSYVGWCKVDVFVQVIYRNSFAAPLFSLVATATRASKRPMPVFRAGDSYMLDRGSRSLLAGKSST